MSDVVHFGEVVEVFAEATAAKVAEKMNTLISRVEKAERDALAARVKALEAALEPFARIDLLHDDGWDDTDDIELMFGDYATLCRVTVADLRRARALLAQLEGD